MGNLQLNTRGDSSKMTPSIFSGILFGMTMKVGSVREDLPTGRQARTVAKELLVRRPTTAKCLELGRVGEVHV